MLYSTAIQYDQQETMTSFHSFAFVNKTLQSLYQQNKGIFYPVMELNLKTHIYQLHQSRGNLPVFTLNANCSSKQLKDKYFLLPFHLAERQYLQIQTITDNVHVS